MARLVDRTMMTADEEFNPEDRIAAEVRAVLKRIKMDTYNNLYTVRVTVDRIDPAESREKEDDDE